MLNHVHLLRPPRVEVHELMRHWLKYGHSSDGVERPARGFWDGVAGRARMTELAASVNRRA